jgi:hypothetical protein
MSRTTNKIIRNLLPALVVAAAVVPTASAADDGSSQSARIATELGQAVGEPGGGNGTFERTATELGQSTGGLQSAWPGDESSERTVTEVGQAVGEPADGNLARAVWAGDQGLSSPAGESGRFNWGDAALGAGAALALAVLGGAAFLTVRRRRAVSHSAASTS